MVGVSYKSSYFGPSGAYKEMGGSKEYKISDAPKRAVVGIVATLAVIIITLLIVVGIIWQSNTIVSQDQDIRSDASSGGDNRPTKKFNPGHYIQGFPLDTSPGDIKKIMEDPKLQAARGVRIPITWKAFEPTRGNYNWKLIDDYLDAIGPNKQMIFHWWSSDIWAKNCDSATRIPAYMLPYCTKLYSGSGVHGNASVKWWEKGPRDEMIRVLQALADHYDKNPRFEGIMFDETNFGIPPTDQISSSDFEKAKLESYKIIHSAIAPHFATSQVFQPMNWLGGADCKMLRELTDHLQALGHGVSNPDSAPWKALPRGCGTAYTNAPESRPGDRTDNLWWSIAVYTIFREYANKIPTAVGGDTSQFENPLATHPRIFNNIPMNMANLVDMLYKQAVTGYTYAPTGEFVPGFGANYLLWNQSFGNNVTPYTAEARDAYRSAFYPLISNPNKKTNTTCPSNIKCNSSLYTPPPSTPPPTTPPPSTPPPSTAPPSTPPPSTAPPSTPPPSTAPPPSAPPPSSGGSGNIIKNSKLNSVIPDWYQGKGGRLLRDDEATKYTIIDNKEFNQLMQSGLTLQKGATYSVRFRAKASISSTISISIIKDTAPYTNYIVSGNTKNLNLSTAWKNFDLTFVAGGFNGIVNDARFRFEMNGAPNNTSFWYDSIEIKKL